MGYQISTIRSYENQRGEWTEVILGPGMSESIIENALSSGAGKTLMQTLKSAINSYDKHLIIKINKGPNDAGGTDYDVDKAKGIITITLPENLMGIPVGYNQFATYDTATVFIHELSHAILRIDGVSSRTPNEEDVVHSDGEENQYTADTHYFTNVAGLPFELQRTGYQIGGRNDWTDYREVLKNGLIDDLDNAFPRFLVPKLQLGNADRKTMDC